MLFSTVLINFPNLKVCLMGGWPRDRAIVQRFVFSNQLNLFFSVMPERKSFRAYSAILYLDPRMKIYIQVTAAAVIAIDFFSFIDEESVLKRLVNLFTGEESAHKTVRR